MRALLHARGEPCRRACCSTFPRLSRQGTKRVAAWPAQPLPRPRPPQPLSPSTYFHRLHELALRPEALPDLLVDRLGFRLVKRLQPPSAAAAGFDRPMFLFRKPA